MTLLSYETRRQHLNCELNDTERLNFVDTAAKRSV